MESKVIHGKSFVYLPWVDTMLGAETITLKNRRHSSGFPSLLSEGRKAHTS